MNRIFLIAGALAAMMSVSTGCFPDGRIDPTIGTQQPANPNPNPTPNTNPNPGPEEEKPLSYDNLSEYDVLKSYVNREVSPDFKLGAAVTVSNFLGKSQEYKMATENFDEMTAGNAMKQASILKNDGTMDFSQVKKFLDAAQEAGMTVYGHTLAWHSQQAEAYLNGLIAGKKVEVPDGTGEEVILEEDFDDGNNPFIGWGNDSAISVSNGVFKASNPSVVQSWEAQFAYDVTSPFVKGQEYSLSFRIKGSAEGRLAAGFQIVDGYKTAGEFGNIEFDTQWKTIEVKCECTAGEGTRLIFSFGEFKGDIYIDDFQFKAVGLDYTYVTMKPEDKKEALTAAMDRWIKAVMEVTATRVSAWDAVNEPISGSDRDGDGFYDLETVAWVNSGNFYWQDYLGSEDYIRIVIDRARKYYAEYGGTAPLRLFINDYNLESDWDDNKKLKSLIHWIEVWESDGVTKIDGIGTQMHISYYENEGTQKSKEDHIVKMFQLMAATGKLVKISELDMGYIDMSGNTLKASQVSDKQHRQMADYYEFIVRKYFEIIPPAQQYGITQWCPTDAPDNQYAWRAGEPVGLWDKNYNRKYAYAGFANGLMGDL